jgi:hypothetical protein
MSPISFGYGVAFLALFLLPPGVICWRSPRCRCLCFAA